MLKVEIKDKKPKLSAAKTQSIILLYLYDLQPSFPNETLLLADEIFQISRCLRSSKMSLCVLKNTLFCIIIAVPVLKYSKRRTP